MSNAIRHNRKASDEQIISLNCVGLPLRTIGAELDIHHSTVKTRLDSLGIPPADTRHAFMEDIYYSMSPVERQWLCDQLSEDRPIKTYVKELILQQRRAQIGNQLEEAA